MGHTWEKNSEHLSENCHDIKDRPDNSKLAKLFSKNCDINGNLNVTILENNKRVWQDARRH